MVNPNEIDLEKLEPEEILRLISRCHEELDARQSRRIEEVQEQVAELARSVNMTPEEIVMHMQRGKKPGANNSKIAYRNPQNPSQTWAGRGKRPKWLNEKLEEGALLQDFRVIE
jgi:DNA-binding protein H-NS